MKFSTKGSSCGTTSSFSLQSKGEAGRPFSPLAVNIHNHYMMKLSHSDQSRPERFIGLGHCLARGGCETLLPDIFQTPSPS